MVQYFQAFYHKQWLSIRFFWQIWLYTFLWNTVCMKYVINYKIIDVRPYMLQLPSPELFGLVFTHWYSLYLFKYCKVASIKLCFYLGYHVCGVCKQDRFVKVFLLRKLETKGQLISKGLFGFFNSPKKRTKTFCPSRLGQKLTFSSLFSGRIEDTKIFFRD